MSQMQRVRSRLAFFVCALGACSNPSGTVVLTTGVESDTFTRSPAPTSLLVEAVQSDGTRTTLADAGLPATGPIDLGSPSSSMVASIQVTASAAGTKVVSGASPFIELLALEGITLPVFVQRNGEFARMPGSLPDGRSALLSSVTSGGVYGAGGVSDAGTPVFGYDLVFLNQFSTECPVDRTPRSIALENAGMLLVDDNGATVLDLTNCVNTDLGALSDAGTPAWVSVSGGVTVVGDDGSAYIVGQTKPDVASNTILKVDTSGNITAQTTTTQRKGAAAAWATGGHGLFIYGGTDSSGPEIVGSGSSITLNYPADATAGLVTVQADTNTMLVVGPTVLETIDLGCSSACAPKPFGQAANADGGLPVALANLAVMTGVFKVATGVFLAVGDDAQGKTHALRIDATSIAEVPLKIPRVGARAAQTQTGAVLILGGGSTTVESYVP